MGLIGLLALTVAPIVARPLRSRPLRDVPGIELAGHVARIELARHVIDGGKQRNLLTGRGAEVLEAPGRRQDPRLHGREDPVVRVDRLADLLADLLEMRGEDQEAVVELLAEVADRDGT